MEQETILYYYPMTEQQIREAGRYAARRRWYQEAVLGTDGPARQTETGFCVLGCAVPPFYYRRRPWKPQILSETMEKALGHAAGMTDTCVHFEIEALLTEAFRAKWMPREKTVQMLVKDLLHQYGPDLLWRSGMVTVLLGQPEDTERQMEMTWELLVPYLPRVNRMLLYYEESGTSGEDGEAAAAPPGLSGYLEDYYYEYGLVPQAEPYRRMRGSGTAGETGVLRGEDSGGSGMSRHGSIGETDMLRCGRALCGGIILDYGDAFRYPRVSGNAGENSIYIDVSSSREKERMLRQKGLSIPCLSPMKYLDTIVKSSYSR